MIAHSNSHIRAVRKGGLESTGAAQCGQLLPKIGAGYGESLETEKYQARERDRLHVNREAGKKVQQTRACETRNAVLLQLGFTDSNRRKRKCKRKQQQPPSVSPLLISRIRKQPHAEKVNCAPRSKLPAKPNQASKAGTHFFHFSSNISSQLHKSPKYKLNCKNEKLLHQYRPNIINFASPGRGEEKKLQRLNGFPCNVLFTTKAPEKRDAAGGDPGALPGRQHQHSPALRRRSALLRCQKRGGGGVGGEGKAASFPPES